MLVKVGLLASGEEWLQDLARSRLSMSGWACQRLWSKNKADKVGADLLAKSDAVAGC